MIRQLFSTGTSDRKAVIWLTVLGAATHFRWLFDFKVFTSGDWWYIAQQRYHDFFTQFSPIWVTDGLGSTSATPHFYLIRFFEGLLSSVGSSFVLNEKLFFFIPMAFAASLGAYFLLRQYFNEWPAFIGAIIFAFNTAALFNHVGPLTIGVATSLAPWAIFSFKKFIQSPDSTRLLIATAAIFGIMAVYELRLTLVIGSLAIGLFVFRVLLADGWQFGKTRLWPLTKLGLLLLAFHAFWLLPYLISARAVTFSDVLGRGLFVSFSDIQNALTLHHPFWTGLRPATFIVQPIPILAWIIPIAAFGGFLLRPKHLDKEICYWAFIALTGIFLVKQVHEPFTNAYPWLYEHLPGFGAFRESSKFYVVIALAYAVLIPFTLLVLKHRLQMLPRRKFLPPPLFLSGLATTLVLSLFLVNTIPLLTGDFRTLYTPRKMPADYSILEKFINNQPGYFRTLWVPVNSRWSVQSNLHPNIQATNINQGAWLSQIGDTKQIALATLRDKAVKIFMHETSDNLLDRASIKYVIIPLRDTANEDDFFRYYGDDRNYYIEKLDNLSYLKRIDIGAKDLVVYENQGYQPYITSFSNLQTFALSKHTDIAPFYDVIRNQLHSSLNFTVEQPGDQAYPKAQIKNVFQDISASDVQHSKVTKIVGPFEKPMLYIKPGTQQLRYVLQKGTITFYGQQPTVQANGASLETTLQPEKLLATRVLNGKAAHYLVAGDEIALLPEQDSQKEIDALLKPLELYEAGNNILPNPSFEKGLWQAKVQDCNRYDANAKIAMALAQDMGTEGENALELNADRHSACTESPAIQKNSDTYLLSFEYQLLGGRSAGFEVIFNDSRRTKIKQDLHTNSGSWQKYQKVIKAPVGASSFKIKLLGYPDYRLQKSAFTYYDNLRLQPLAPVFKIDPAAQPQEPLPLAARTPLQVTYRGETNLQATNPIKNGSFQDGLWQKKVADCDAYDSRPAIRMKLVARTDPDDKALELAARRHAACTSQKNISVIGGSHYVFSFEHQSPNAATASYFLRFNDTNKTTIEERVPTKDSQWHTYTRQIRAPLGANSLDIVVYAYNHTGDNGQEIINRYDNFSLEKVPGIVNNTFFIVDTPAQATNKPAQVSYEPLHPTKKLIQIKGATTPFYLSMSESYNPLWRLELNNDKASSALPTSQPDAVPATMHFKLNDFENGWYVDPAALCRNNPEGCQQSSKGIYDLELIAEFTPQRWFYAGSAVSLLAVTICAGYLIYKLRAKGGRR
jgi:hypothetical protein